MGPLGIILFVIALVASIMLHEAGHMVCARKAGGKVTEFFLGFGPKIWSFRKGETEYGVKAIPAGGYVKIVGMTDLEPIAPEDEPRAFYKKPLGWRLLTLAAGSLVHFLIALVLFLIIAMFWGRTSVPPVIGGTAPCLSPHASSCTSGDPAATIEGFGLQAGDKILAVNDRPVKSWTDVTDVIGEIEPRVDNGVPVSPPVPLTFSYQRQGVTATSTPITPAIGNKSSAPKAVCKGLMVGITPPAPQTKDLSVPAAAGQGFSDWGSDFKASVAGLVDIPKSIPKLFQKQQSTDGGGCVGAPVSDRPVGVIGMGNITGDLIKTNGYASFLNFVADINVFIGIFNLLPLLPLDGGHIAIALYEAARRKVAVLRGRPDPGRVDLNKLMPAAFTFLVLFVGLSLLLMAADITNPLKFPS